MHMQEVVEISKRYKALINACTLINSTLDIDALLQIVTKQAMDIMDAEASSLLLIDQTSDELHFKVALGRVADKLKNLTVRIGEGIAGWVVKNGRPLLIGDVEKDSRFFNGVDLITGFVTKSLICVPLKSTGKILGCIEVLNKKDNSYFDESDVEFLLAMANQAAITIDNAILLQQVRMEKNRIESIVSSMTDGVIVTDEKSKIVIMNPAARKIFDLDSKSSEASLSSKKLTFLLKETQDLERDSLFDIVLMKPESVILSNNVTILKNQDEKKSGVVMVLRNITENKEREIMRSEFFTLLTFKLFAPLENLLREVELFSGQLNSGNNGESIENLLTSVKSIKNFVQKLHYFSELDAGPLRLEKSSYRLAELIEEAVSQSQEEIENLKIDAKLPEVNDSVKVDGGRVIEAIVLLIYFFSAAINLEQELNLELHEKNDIFEIKFKNPIPKRFVEKAQTLCSSINLVEDFCRLKEGDNSLELLELAFVRHLMDAHGGKVCIIDENNSEYLVITMPKETGE